VVAWQGGESPCFAVRRVLIFVMHGFFMKFSLKSPFLPLVSLILACPMQIQAAISIQGSRVIYDEARGEAAIQVRQAGEIPGLVQVWLDAGDDAIDPQMQDIPFLITPVVSRIEPGNGQSIRVLRIGEGLPQDRESMFFFNVLEVPPSATQFIADDDNSVQFSTRARMKFFYRPKGLQTPPQEAHQLLRFSLLSDADGQTGMQVRVHNPSPYHITFKTLTLQDGLGDDAPAVAELSRHVGVHETTVVPMGELLLPLDSLSSEIPVNISGLQVAFGVIGDHGNIFSALKKLD